MIKDLELKLSGLIPIESKEELKYLISSWDYEKGYFGKKNEEIKNQNYLLDKLDVSNLSDLSNIFACSKFNGDISNWNTSNCENMSMMFQSSIFNGDISNWNVSKVKKMSMMFSDSNFNGDLSKWNVSNVKNMSHMFSSSKFNNDSLKDWDISNVEDMSFMFDYSKFNGNIKNWKPTNLIKNINMFEENKVFEKKNKKLIFFYKNLNFYKRKEFKRLKNIKDLISGNIPIKKWELLQLINSWGRLEYSSYSLERNVNFELKYNNDLKCYPLENLDVSQIEDLSMIFIGSMYNGDLSKWNVSNCRNMNGMFDGSKFNNNSLKDWNTSNVTNMGEMFANSPFNGNISKWNTSNCISMFQMFYNSHFNNDISNWNTLKVSSFISMFEKTNFSGNISKLDFSYQGEFEFNYLKDIFKNNESFKLIYNQNNEIPNNTKEFIIWFENNKEFINLQYNLTKGN